jgi:sugar/nucleoside kinase (ribokinase family)
MVGHNVVVVSDGAYDIFIHADPEQYTQLQRAYQEKNDISAKGMLNLAGKLDARVTQQPGGPVLTIGQHFAVRKAEGLVNTVNAIYVCGNRGDDPSSEYKKTLRNLGIKTSSRSRNGTMPQCVYVLNPESDNPSEIPPLWQGNASDDERKVIIGPQAVAGYDTLIAANTDPSRMAAALRNFKGRLAVYNPGPALGGYLNFEETRFSELVGRANVLSLNEHEARAAILGLDYTSSHNIEDIFQEVKSPEYFAKLSLMFGDQALAGNLELIVVTLGARGAVAMRRGEDPLFCDQTKLPYRLDTRKVVSTVGAGDLHLAETVIGFWRGRSTQELLQKAALSAQEALTHLGGVNPRYLGGSTSPFPSVSRVKVAKGRGGANTSPSIGERVRKIAERVLPIGTVEAFAAGSK